MSIDLVVGLKFLLLFGGLMWLAWRQAVRLQRSRLDDARRARSGRDTPAADGGDGPPPSV
ncbi:MAG: hypothetical protein ACK4WC_02490 [Rubrimonas sp.]